MVFLGSLTDNVVDGRDCKRKRKGKSRIKKWKSRKLVFLEQSGAYMVVSPESGTKISP
jgi:hypothetical protein